MKVAVVHLQRLVATHAQYPLWESTPWQIATTPWGVVSGRQDRTKILMPLVLWIRSSFGVIIILAVIRPS